jgi:hypothetical protein
MYDPTQLDPGALTNFTFPGVMPRMVDPQSIALATQDPNGPPSPMPITAAHKPSIMDKVLESLYPEGAFGGFLPPDVLRSERMAALRHAGLSLMAAGGPRPQGTRNVGADIAQAIDPAQWEQHLSGVAQTGMQLQSMMKKLQDDQTAKQIMAANPAKPNETPQQYEQRLRRLSGQFLQAGLGDHAKVVSQMISEVRPEKIETDLVPPDKTPDGSVQLVNKQTGDVIKSWMPNAKSALTPSEKAEKTLAYRKEFDTQVGPVTGQMQAYKAYKAAPWGGANDALKLANAIKIVVPSSTVTAAQVLSGQAEANFGGMGLIGELLKGFSAKGELDKAGQTALEAYVESQMPNVKASAQTLIQQHRSLAESVGLDPNQTTYDPTIGETSLTPVPAIIQQRAAKVRKAAGAK